MLSGLVPFLQPRARVLTKGPYIAFDILNPSPALQANAYYFNQQEWAEEYLKSCHRSASFTDRWTAALGDVSDKVVVDIGCGPGNIFASLGTRPKVLIGVDVAPASLMLARRFGYIPVLANAESLPFISGFADIVVMNATLHHCENMQAVLREASRLVKPGGSIVTDHDPQLSAWDYKGIARVLWNARLVLYKLLGKGFHKSDSQQASALASEVHHKPGDGVTEKLFKEVLEPLRFSVCIFCPHNHQAGAEVLKGVTGKAEMKYRIGNLLSGRNPHSDASALSLMCVAKKLGSK